MSTTASDALLAARLRARDHTAWEELYQAYEGRLYGFAYRLTGNGHDAADLVQETFVRVLPRLDRLDPEKLDIGAYLFQTEKNLFLKSVARRKRQEPVEEVPEPTGPAPIEDDPERSTLLRRQQTEVQLANAKLAPRQRLVLALRELEDKSYAEIGDLIGVKENAVAQLISRARQNLRDELRLIQVDRSKLPAECQRLLPALSAYLDGELKGPKLDQTLAHLDGCEYCQAALADMREAQRRYRSLIPPVSGLVGLQEQIEHALRRLDFWSSPPSPPPFRRRWRLGRASQKTLGYAIAGAVGVGVLVGGVAWLVAREPPRAQGGRPVGVGPTVRLLASPQDGTASTHAAFAFSANQAGAQFECRLDGARAEPCSSPKTYSGLAPARHLFAVTATGSGKRGAGVSYSWSIRSVRTPDVTAPVVTITAQLDAIAPSTSITGRPADPTASTSASFGFGASESGVRLECSLDGTAFEACSSPKRYSDLADRRHTFSVRANDKAGNTGPAATVSWSVDTTAPLVTIVRKPSRLTSSIVAGLAFRANEAGARFACSRDGSPFGACSSPKSYGGLAEGQHSFAVRAKDPAGNLGPVASYRWRIDTTAPGVSITSRPPRLTRSAAAAFAFVTEARARLACSLDGAPFSSCASPKSYGGLLDGKHVFAVRAVDPAGNAGRAATVEWTVDTMAPTVTITQTPAALTNAAVASFSFTASEAGAGFACSLDGALFALCSSPKSYAQLAQGKHSFSVRAKDQAGNLGPVASYSWTIDTTPPTTAITSKPTDPMTSGSASFAFSASEPGSQFACALDGSAFVPCSSPQSYTGLGPGRHTFAVRATDPAGNSGPAASYSWTIATPLPDLVISRVSSTSFTVSNVGKATAGPFVVTVSGVGTFSFRGLAAGASATRTLPCSESTRAATVDAQNQVAESNEANNTAKIPAGIC